MPAWFQVFGDQLVESNGERRQAMEKLARVIEDASADEQAAVETFGTRYGLLAAAWRTFHNEYDDWRRTDGGCDRSKALEALAQFTADFSRSRPRAAVASGDKSSGLPERDIRGGRRAGGRGCEEPPKHLAPL